MTHDLMKELAHCVWKGPHGAFFTPQSALVMDSMSAHIVPGVKDCFHKELKTDLVIIPGGLTCKLQPLEVGVNHVFKIHLRQEWERWMQEGIHTFTTSGKMRRVTFAEVCSWVLKAWGKVSKETIVNSFRKTLFPSDEVFSDLESDDENEADEDELLSDELIQLFYSDSEESDFDGFSESEI